MIKGGYSDASGEPAGHREGRLPYYKVDCLKEHCLDLWKGGGSEPSAIEIVKDVPFMASVRARIALSDSLVL